MRASRPTGTRVVVAIPFGRAFARGCRGGPWSSRGCSRRRRVPRDDLRPKSRTCGPVGLRNAPAGAVQASSPTEVCNTARLAFSRCLHLHLRPQGRIPYPPAKLCAAAGCGGMRASRPTGTRVVVAIPFGRAFARGCRGGPWSSRGCSRRRRVPRDDLRPKSRTCGPVGLRNAPAGAVQASSPTGV